MRLVDGLPFLPAGLPQGLTVGDMARVLRLSEATVKSALASGSLPSWQLGTRRGWRYVTPEALLAWAEARGIQVYWDELSKQ